jgi:hypothetical protein
MPNTQCAICGTFSEQPEAPSPDLAPPAALAAPDLDTRPPEPERSTIGAWMQDCPSCGYAAADLTRAAPGVDALLKTAGYKECPGPFARHAYILERLGFYADAGWTALHGAWAFDDAGDESSARRMRSAALSYWKEGRGANQHFMETVAEEFSIVTDILRRIGDFGQAQSTARIALQDEHLPPLLEDALRFQLTLIQQKDAAVHSLAELPARPRGGKRVTLQ